MGETDFFYQDEVYGEQLLVSTEADVRELHGNIRAARAILSSFPSSSLIINPHSREIGSKNPEYTIDGLLGDRKGIMSEKGVTAGFRSAKRQGCKVVVIDLDERVGTVRPFYLSKYIARRRADFANGDIVACYVVFNGKAVKMTNEQQTRMVIEECIQKLKP